MKIFSLLNRRMLRPSWTFTPNGSIWRLLPTETGEFVGEARNQEEKKASFFALNGKSGTVLWQDLKLSEAWWVGIEDVSAGVVLLHKFASPDMPQHKGLVAVDLKSGSVLWENTDLTFWHVHGSSVLATRMLFEKRAVVELDLRTGSIGREYSEESDLEALRSRDHQDFGVNRSLTFPEVLEDGSADSPAVRRLRKGVPAKSLFGHIEYTVASGYLLANFHLRSRNADGETTSLDNHFMILDCHSTKVVYDDIIAHGSSAPVPDSFFVKNETVYFIKDQKTLTAIRLG